MRVIRKDHNQNQYNFFPKKIDKRSYFLTFSFKVNIDEYIKIKDQENSKNKEYWKDIITINEMMS